MDNMKQAIEDVTEWLEKRECLFFVGNGLSMVEKRPVPEIPSSAELITRFRELVPDIPKNEDLDLAATKVVRTNGVPALAKVLVELCGNDREPGDGHRALAAVHPDLVITTNYDTLIESAMRKRGSTPTVMMNDSDLRYITERQPSVIKLHGDVEVIERHLQEAKEGRIPDDQLRESFILDYIQYDRFSKTRPLLALQIQLWWGLRHMVILGQSFDEPHVHQMLKEFQRSFHASPFIRQLPEICWIGRYEETAPSRVLHPMAGIRYVQGDLMEFLNGVAERRRKLALEDRGNLKDRIDIIITAGGPTFMANCCAGLIAGDVPVGLFRWKTEQTHHPKIDVAMQELQSLYCLVPSYGIDTATVSYGAALRECVKLHMRNALDNTDGWITQEKAIQRWREYLRGSEHARRTDG